MSSDDVNGASMTQSLHLHLGLAPNQGDSEEESEDDDKGDDSIATFNVKWQIQNGEVRLPVVLFIAFDGVKVQVQNAPQVGHHWEYPMIKGWESSKKHFGFKSENARTRQEEHFKFDTQEVRQSSALRHRLCCSCCSCCCCC